jgi:hypothetical protein
MLWPYQLMVGMPRVAAIEHPFGRPFGRVGDVETQRAVLLAALDVLNKAKTPGHIEHLPFVWPEDPKETKWHPLEPSPIIAMLKNRSKKPA